MNALSTSKQKWAKMAALTAVGSAMGSNALAAIIVTPVNQVSGYVGGALTPPTGLLIDLPGINDFMVIGATIGPNGAAVANGPFATNYVRFNRAPMTIYNFTFRLINGATGQTFNTIAGTGTGSYGFFGLHSTSSSEFGSTSFSGRYFAFRFVDSNTASTHYGWLQVDFNNIDFNNVYVDVLRYAYQTDPDTTIAMGDTGGGGAVPEATSTALFGMAAMVMGAAGVRRWRMNKAEKPAAA